MQLTISQTELQVMLAKAAEIGATRALAAVGSIKPYLNKQEAFKLYGRSNVNRWLKEGLITPRKDGTASANWRLDRVELETVSKASNRHTYLTTEERK